MKKIIFLPILLISIFVNSQTTKIEYNLNVKNTLSGKMFTFPATLYYNQSGNSVYTVQYGISHQYTLQELNDGNILINKGSYIYQLYNNGDTLLIKDVIDAKNYIFKDKLPIIHYADTNETKVINDIVVTKAIVEFRGRKYTLWYDKNTKIKTGPWKFIGLNGLAYEISDDSGHFSWTLKQVTEIKDDIKKLSNTSASDVLPYTEYPKLKYAPITGYVQDRINPSTQKAEQYEQIRDGLETIFEWEK